MAVEYGMGLMEEQVVVYDWMTKVVEPVEEEALEMEVVELMEEEVERVGGLV